MPKTITRVLSDIHFGDRASRVHHLDELRPMTEGATALVFNGDTLDTRPGPNPDHTAACQAELAAFTRQTGLPAAFITGNHDPDISSQHCVDLAHGEVFAVHGDVLFDNIVPWGRDARTIRAMIRQALQRGPVQHADALPLDERLALWRQVAGSIPQRHQSERNLLKYAVRFIADTVWPPNRFVEIFRSWHREPHLAETLLSRARPQAKYILLGHTHRPTIRRRPNGLVVINTGAYTAPFGGFAVDVGESALTVRRVERRGGEFRLGHTVAEFPLANG